MLCSLLITVFIQEIHTRIQAFANKTMTLHLEYGFVLRTKGLKFSTWKLLTNQAITLQVDFISIS